MKFTRSLALLLVVLLALSSLGSAIAMVKLKAADDSKTEAYERASATVQDADAVGRRARQELSLVLGYVRGAATRDDIETARAEFRESVMDARGRIHDEDKHASDFGALLDNFTATEAAIFRVSTLAGPTSLWDVVDERDRTEAEALATSAAHAKRLASLSAGATNATTRASLEQVRVAHAEARIALLEFAPRLIADASAAELRAQEHAKSMDVAIATLGALAAAHAAEPADAEFVAALQTLATDMHASQTTRDYFATTRALHRHAGELLGARSIHFELLSEATIQLANEDAALHRIEAHAQQQGARLVMAGTIVAVSIPVVLGGVVLAGRFRKRLSEFDAASLAVSQGRFETPPPPPRGDDFDNLANAWGQMVTALDQRAREVAEKNDVLLQNERMAALGSLLAGVAHEVNNPLAFIKSNEEMSVQDLDAVLADPNTVLSDGVRANLDGVRASLVANVDGIARVEKINRALKGFGAPKRDARELVDINDVAEGVLIIAHNRLKNKYRIARRLEHVPKVFASAQELGQVILNLVINAAEASPEGGTITVQTQATHEGVRLAVTDDGPGVSPEMRARLFERYATTKASGSGLGLHISRTIAQAHGGDLTLEPKPKGAKFVMTLPQAETASKIPVIISKVNL